MKEISLLTLLPPVQTGHRIDPDIKKLEAAQRDNKVSE